MSASSITFKRKRALVVGIDEYSFSPLKYCVQDAKDFAKSLTDIGFKVYIVHNSNRTEFQKAIEEFINGNRPNDLILFYFAGHAKVHNNQNYLLLTNYKDDRHKVEKCLEDGAILINLIVQQSAYRKDAITIIIIDSHRKSLSPPYNNANLAFMPIQGLQNVLIVYPKCKEAVQCSESAHERNGHLMKMLLQWITIPNIEINEIMKQVDDGLRKQTNGIKSLQRSGKLMEKLYLSNTSDQDAASANETPRRAAHADQCSLPQYVSQQYGGTGVRNARQSDQSSIQEQSKQMNILRSNEHNPVSSSRSIENRRRAGASSYAGHLGDQVSSSLSSSTHPVSDHRRTVNPYPSEIFGVNSSTSEDLWRLFEHLRYGLPVMNKKGPMSGDCIHETDQMEEFLKKNFGFRNTDGYIVPGVREFKLHRYPSHMDNNELIYFPNNYSKAFVMRISEIKKWQNSYFVYADRKFPEINPSFLSRALAGKSRDGDEAYLMKFVVRISDCPIMMKFDSKILSRSLEEDWPHLIKLVSVTGIDFAGRQHDVNDVTTYIKNWEKVFVIDNKTGKPAVFHGRDFYPVRNQPPAILDKKRLLEDLICMVRLRLYACHFEGVQVVVETGIGLGVFAGKHIGIDDQVRKLSASAICHVLQKEASKLTNIRAIVLALPIFSRTSDGREIRDTYHDFVDEFRASKYDGPLPVLIIDQDMHELTVAIARQKYRVSQLNPADSHGVFGEYWQNHGPAVEEKLALTTVGLLVQHHLINFGVLDEKRYKFI